MLWFRRDLRLADHPALLAAASDAGRRQAVVPLFVVDPQLWGPAGAPRRAWLIRSLRELRAGLAGRLVVLHGRPEDVVPALAAQVRADRVHVTADAGPYGRRRDAAVAAALGRDGRALVATGTPYAVGPGTITRPNGRPYAVFTPFFRAWAQHGWPAPAGSAAVATDTLWMRGVDSQELPAEPDPGTARWPDVGEEAAGRRWAAFVQAGLRSYDQRRDRPDVDGTSALSAHLKYGEIHPRTLLADLAAVRSAAGLSATPANAIDSFRRELCWREFYADVLWHRPESARANLRPEFDRMRVDPPGERFEAWRRGRTGYPFVDAGMRQLLAEGWVHNRVRMVVASFLVKDLHVWWTHGARWFMERLRDGDLASNQHGWQWAAGTGTDAAPFFRVFNPVVQGQRFDPDGDYVRRHIPELRHIAGGSVHEPWSAPDGYGHGYPERIVDHARERTEALRRYEEVR